MKVMFECITFNLHILDTYIQCRYTVFIAVKDQKMLKKPDSLCMEMLAYI